MIPRITNSAGGQTGMDVVYGLFGGLAVIYVVWFVGMFIMTRDRH